MVFGEQDRKVGYNHIQMTKKVILTGLRANNDLTIGNYFGALLPIVDMAKTRAGEFQVNLFVPDLHSFTTPIDHSLLQEQIMHNLRVFVAAGLPLDNPDVHIYRQSYISAHSELTWILSCFTGVGQMSRMTQFKDKSQGAGEDSVSMGLYSYPILMAADILLYNASYVPVGDDQTQHLEFARDIAQRMNSRFNQELFTVPLDVKSQHAFFMKDQGLRIKDLINPEKKMSKSDESGRGVIFLGDDPDSARKKVMGATTDSYGEIIYDPAERAGIANIIDLLALFQNSSSDEVYRRYQGQTMYGPLKEELATEVAKFLSSFQSKLNDVDDRELIRKINESERAMTSVANETLLRVQKAVGLR